MLGIGNPGATTTGFDILSVDYGYAQGVELVFSRDRSGIYDLPDSSYLYGTSTARISYVSEENNQSLVLKTNTSSITIADNYLYFSIADGSQGVAHMSMDSDGLIGFEAQVNGGVDDSPAYSFLNGIDYGAMIGLYSNTESSALWLIDDQDPNTLGFTPTAISDLMFRSNSSAGSGTQLYVNVDGTDTGWTGIATVDMLTGGSGDLQSAYDNGKVIVTSDGAIELIGSATATIVGTTDIPLLTATFVSGTNEGLDLALFSNSAVPLWSGTGTGMFYRHDQMIDVTNTTSSGLAFSDDGVQSYATLYTKQTGIGSFKYITLDNSGIDISPGSGGTTTFMDNVALNSSARFDSNILPRFTNIFGLGSSSLRWNNFVQSLDIAGSVTGDLVPSANLTYDLGSLGAAWNEAFIDTITANTIGTSALTVGGQNVCLLDGTNCPVTSLSWVYDGVNGLVRLTTSSNDIVLGASATSTGAPVYLETNQTVGTSSLFIGYSTSANVIIGGTSSTMSHMHSLFSGNFNGNDLYVGGNIGSASSVYTLGEFVAGSGSAHYGDGYLRQTIGDYTFEVAGGDILPATDLGINLGSSSLRFNGEFGTVTSTGIITDTLAVNSGLTVRPQNGTELANVISSSTQLNGAVNEAKVSGRRLVTLSDVTDSFEIVDLSNVRHPQLVASYSVLGAGPGTELTDFDVQGDVLAIMKSNTGDSIQHLYLYDISGVVLGNVRLMADVVIGDSNSVPAKVVLSGPYAYVSAPGEARVYIYNISDLNNVYEVDSIGISGDAQSITVANDYVYVTYVTGGQGRIAVIPAKDPSNLDIVQIFTGLNQTPLDFRIQGNFAYLTYQNGDATIFDATNPSFLQALNSGDYCGGNVCANIEIAGDYLLETYNNGGNTYIDMVDIAIFKPTATINYPTFPSSDPNNAIRRYFDGTNATTDPIRFVQKMGDMLVVVQSFDLTSATSVVTVVDMGGINTDGIYADAAEIGLLSVRGDAFVQEDLEVLGSLFVGYEGILTQGSINAMSTSSVSFIEGILQVGDHGVGATTTKAYSLSVAYSSTTMSGICVRDSGKECPTDVLLNGNAIIADGSIATNAFDLAEMYDISGPATAGDVLVFDQMATATVQMSGGTRYDRRIAGVVSTKPGFVLGWASASQTQVALAGRVPTKVSMTNGEIKIGDPLTTSEYPGYAMKATKPGMILGYALEDSAATGTIEVFVDTSYNASAALGSDGTIATVTDNLVMVGAEGATATTTAVGSFGLTFHGEGWDTTSSMALAYDFTLRTDMLSSTNSRFVIENTFGSSTFSVDQEGIVRANGYEVNDAFDLAERYESADQLEPGDVVMISKDADRQILRTNTDEAIAIGVISTKAGFTLGANASGTFPVALAGRVPTKVTTMSGAIQRGDALMASTIPGVAQKATVAGQIIGYALENYEGDDNGLVEVFIQPGLWIPQTGLDAMANAPATGSGMGSGPARQGFAKVTTGGSRVSVKYTSILAYPVPQVTAMGNVSGGWWLENVSDVGFDIVMDTIQPIDIQFAWQVSPAQAGIMQYHSDGTYGQLDPLTGELLQNPEGSVEEPVVEESAAEVAVEGE